ncbi:MAG TPA: choice-of-anchor D domain-containing protein, partial [Archangium sp.]
MRSIGTIALVLTLTACKCGPEVAKVDPSLGVSPAGLDFGQVKVGEARQLTLRLEAQTRAAVLFSSVAIEGAGAAAYRLGTTPSEIASQGMETVRITFTPPAVAAYTAALVLSSNDPDRPVIRVALAGEGGLPKIAVALDCQSSRNCSSTV